MKKFEIIITAECTDECFNDEVKDLFNDIESGQMAKDLLEPEEGFSNIEVKYKILE